MGTEGFEPPTNALEALMIPFHHVPNTKRYGSLFKKLFKCEKVLLKGYYWLDYGYRIGY